MENRVVLLLYDRPELVEAFLGALRIGAIPIPINTYETSSFLGYVLNHSKAKALFVEKDLLPLFYEAKGKNMLRHRGRSAELRGSGQELPRLRGAGTDAQG